MSEARRIDTAEGAKLIRAELKRAYPAVTFSVRIHRYSGGSSTRVEWIDGPTTKEVESLVGWYQGSSFDGMIDLRSYHDSELNGEAVYFSNNHVFCTREYSPDFMRRVCGEVCKDWGVNYTDSLVKVSDYDGRGYMDSNIYVKNASEYLDRLVGRVIQDISLVQAVEVKPEAAKTVKGKITATYTGSEWLVTGDTFMSRRDIKAAGGTWDKERKAWVIQGEALPEAVKALCEQVTEQPQNQYLGTGVPLVQPEQVIVAKAEIVPSETTEWPAFPLDHPVKAKDCAYTDSGYTDNNVGQAWGGHYVRVSEPEPPKYERLALPASTEPAAPLEAIALAQAKDSFKPEYYDKMSHDERVLEGLALAMSHYFRWDGLALLKVAALALEDANFHTESAKISDWIESLERE
jgi:hypothetical protein